MDSSRPERVQEVQTALPEEGRERERPGARLCACVLARAWGLKNYDINASSLGINASGAPMLEQQIKRNGSRARRARPLVRH